MNQVIIFRNEQLIDDLRDLWYGTRIAKTAIDYAYWLVPYGEEDYIDTNGFPYPESSMTPWDEFPDGLPPQEAFDFISKYIKSNGRYVKTN